MEHHRPLKALSRLLDIMARLRSPDGCPWDADQTPESLRAYLLEETHEVLQAINEGEPSLIRDELGDLLLQIVFQSRIFEERGEFDFCDVMESITQKLIRRHPHVFDKEKKPVDDDLDRQWHTIKEKEQPRSSTKRSFWARIPQTLPSLSRAGKIFDSLAKTHPGAYHEVTSGRLSAARDTLGHIPGSIDTRPVSETEMGHVLLFLAVVGQKNQIDLEEALRSALMHLEKDLDNFPVSKKPVEE